LSDFTLLLALPAPWQELEKVKGLPRPASKRQPGRPISPGTSTGWPVWILSESSGCSAPKHALPLSYVHIAFWSSHALCALRFLLYCDICHTEGGFVHGGFVGMCKYLNFMKDFLPIAIRSLWLLPSQQR
jgi:hypothetical protein